jgi:hypothetical protein
MEQFDNYNYVNYTDPKHGFSFDIPDNWVKQSRDLGFILSGGRVAYEAYIKKASFNVTTGRIKESDIHDKNKRSIEMAKFLQNSPLFHVESLKVFGLSLGGERNTAYVKYELPREEINAFNIYNPKITSGRMISAFHDGDEYVIHTGSNSMFHEVALDHIIKSFKYVPKV